MLFLHKNQVQLGLFGKKYSIVDSHLLKGATDNHSHILFGVDDGISTAEESLSALAKLEAQGLKELWLTPHTMEDVPNTTEALKARFEELKALYHGSIELHLASEYMMDSLFEKHLEEGDLLTHRYYKSVLIETSTFSAPYRFWETMEEMLKAGYRPILAHPERYMYMEKDDYRRLVDMGVYLQLNYPSIIGAYGKEVRKKAEMILKNGWYRMVGSDCHRSRAIDYQTEAAVLSKSVIERLRAVFNIEEV